MFPGHSNSWVFWSPRVVSLPGSMHEQHESPSAGQCREGSTAGLPRLPHPPPDVGPMTKPWLGWGSRGVLGQQGYGPRPGCPPPSRPYQLRSHQVQSHGQQAEKPRCLGASAGHGFSFWVGGARPSGLASKTD
jgi:hypothetical protein